MKTSKMQVMLGFSLVELLVSIALSALLIGGVASMFVSSRTTYEANDRLARIEENGRFALDSMVRDLYAAGYAGCSKLVETTNTLKGAGAGLLKYEQGVEAHNASGAGTWTPGLDSVAIPSALSGSDVLIAWVPRPGRPALRLRAPMATPTDDILVPIFPSGHDGAFRDLEILMISDCDARAIFQVTDYNPQTGIVKHDAGGSQPGNDTNHLKHTYLKTAQMLSIQNVVYYVRNDANGNPNLYRIIDGAAAEPLVEGVEMMQLRFGEDTSGDRRADRNVRADEVGNTRNIVSVSLALLVRSPEPYGAKEARTYQLLDTSVNKDDRYMRRVFTATATIRNTAE